MAITGQIPRPPLGSSYWPLTTARPGPVGCGLSPNSRSGPPVGSGPATRELPAFEVTGQVGVAA